MPSSNSGFQGAPASPEQGGSRRATQYHCSYMVSSGGGGDAHAAIDRNLCSLISFSWYGDRRPAAENASQ
jgi:hypothetical protein